MDTVSYVYLSILILSIVISAIYFKQYTKQHSFCYGAIFILTIFAEINYFYISISDNPDAILLGRQGVLISLLSIPIFLLYVTFDICHISRRKINVFIMSLICGIIVLSIITTKETGFFYKSFGLELANSYASIDVGFMYIIYYVYTCLTFLCGVIVAIKGLLTNKLISKRNCIYFLIIQFLLLVSGFISGFVESSFDSNSSTLLLIGLILLAITRSIPLYGVETAVYEATEKTGTMGILLLTNSRYVYGFNNSLSMMIPDITTISVDSKLPDEFSLNVFLNEMCDEFDKKKSIVNRIIKHNDIYMSVSVNYLMLNNKIMGYQFLFLDATSEQKLIKIMERYSTDLETEVKKQAEKIFEIMDNVVLGISELIGSRDISTGGHVNRTKNLVAIMCFELMDNNVYGVSDSFYKKIIKAAPLHDLGKIAIDDAILRKPGRFENDEYEIMKLHTQKGGEIVRKVLTDVNDPDFVELAVNVATYHHEKWDGSGYPCGLAGEEIPIEARIMAVADVYDALAHKRCYKEGFDLSKTHIMISDEMGVHFDPKLKECFEKCVPLFEAYYENYGTDD